MLDILNYPPLNTKNKHRIQRFLRPFYIHLLNIIPDKLFAEIKFRWHMGYRLDLANPTTLNEKINWLKLYDRRPLHTICADKYEVRDYVTEKIGNQYLVPLYYQTLDPKEIKPENLSTIPCIIKTNHDSSGGIFVLDKSKIDWSLLQKNLNKRLKTNYYLHSREWQYKNIQPRIIVEKLLRDKNGNIPFDYKLHCFNGKVRMISVDIGRGTSSHSRNWFSTDWKREPYKWSSPKAPSKYTDPSDIEIPKPETLDNMIKLSQILAKPFTYVRVDWYNVDGHLFFGEMTFHHDGGFQPIVPMDWDINLGKELKL